MIRPQAFSATLGRTPADQFEITFFDNATGFRALYALANYSFFAFDPDNVGNDDKVRSIALQMAVSKRWDLSSLGRKIVCFPKYVMSRDSSIINNFLDFVASGIEELTIGGQKIISRNPQAEQADYSGQKT